MEEKVKHISQYDRICGIAGHLPLHTQDSAIKEGWKIVLFHAG